MKNLFFSTKNNTSKLSPYASFNSRLIANLIDLFIMGILLWPLFAITSSIIYGNILPSEILNNIAQELNESIANNKNIDAWSFVKSNKKFQDYFIIHHGFIKIIIDQLFQLTILGCIILFFWIRKQATLGKICLGIKIVDAKTLGKPTNKQLVIRLISCILSSLPLFMGVIWIIFDPKKQSWHDKIAKTLVIKENK